MHEAIKKISDVSCLGEKSRKLLEFFATLGVATTTYEHPAIFTVEEGIALDLPGQIPGQHGKSLFLKDAKGAFWLIVAAEETRVDLKGLAKRVEAKRFSFASAEVMQQILGVTPGSATPFALVNDHDRQVEIVIDTVFAESESCVFHPLDNRYSTVMAYADLLRFVAALGYDARLLPVA